MASETTILQPIIDSKCSPDVEKYLCYARLPPCTADISKVQLPCRELCQRVNRDCEDAFKQLLFPPLHCDYLFPAGDSISGLCDVTRWPAPWPWKIPEPLPPTSGKDYKAVFQKINLIIFKRYIIFIFEQEDFKASETCG